MATEAMQRADPIPGKCNARNRDGTLCSRRAGWGTDHVGYGNCKNHGGSTPNGRKSAAKAGLAVEAIKLGQSLEVEPDELMLNTVYLTAGALAFAMQQAGRIEAGEEDSDRGRIAQSRLADALDRSARVSKMAMDAGISDRQVRLVQRWGRMLAGVIEEAMGEMAEFFPPEVRTKFAQKIQVGMARLERGEIEAPDA